MHRKYLVQSKLSKHLLVLLLLFVQSHKLVTEVKIQNKNFLQIVYSFSFYIMHVYALCTMHVYSLNLVAKNL